MYMVPSGANFTPPWNTGSSPGTPISWQHAGIKDCEQFVGKELDVPFCRTGNVIITVGGHPTHKILGRVVEPGKWKIVLGGGRAGIVDVLLDSDVLSQELTSGLLRRSASMAGSPIRVSVISKCGSPIDGSEQLNITAPSKEAAIAREWWSCGSGGCNIQITLQPVRKFANAFPGCDQ
jgi:hypothetical protein